MGNDLENLAGAIFGIPTEMLNKTPLRYSIKDIYGKFDVTVLKDSKLRLELEVFTKYVGCTNDANNTTHYDYDNILSGYTSFEKEIPFSELKNKKL